MPIAPSPFDALSLPPITAGAVPALVQCPCGCGRTDRVLVPVALGVRA
jgi:hypothetical protein